MPILQQFSIKDPEFSIDELHSYQLLIEMGLDHIGIAVFDPKKNALKANEEYLIQGNPDTEELIAALDELYAEHPFISAQFWNKVQVVVQNFKYTLVPSELFDAEKVELLMKPIAPLDTTANLAFSTFHPRLNLYTLFFLRKDIQNWFKEKYKNLQLIYKHFSDLVLETALSQPQIKEKLIFIHVGKEQFTFSFFLNNQLRYFNTFLFTQEPDFIYFILFAIRELGLDREKDKFLLWGNISEQSPLFAKLKIYINHLSFAKRPYELHFAYTFDELLDQQLTKFAAFATN